MIVIDTTLCSQYRALPTVVDGQPIVFSKIPIDDPEAIHLSVVEEPFVYAPYVFNRNVGIATTRYHKSTQAKILKVVKTKVETKSPNFITIPTVFIPLDFKLADFNGINIWSDNLIFKPNTGARSVGVIRANAKSKLRKFLNIFMAFVDANKNHADEHYATINEKALAMVHDHGLTVDTKCEAFPGEWIMQYSDGGVLQESIGDDFKEYRLLHDYHSDETHYFNRDHRDSNPDVERFDNILAGIRQEILTVTTYLSLKANIESMDLFVRGDGKFGFFEFQNQYAFNEMNVSEGKVVQDILKNNLTHYTNCWYREIEKLMRYIVPKSAPMDAITYQRIKEEALADTSTSVSNSFMLLLPRADFGPKFTLPIGKEVPLYFFSENVEDTELNIRVVRYDGESNSHKLYDALANYNGRELTVTDLGFTPTIMNVAEFTKIHKSATIIECSDFKLAKLPAESTKALFIPVGQTEPTVDTVMRIMVFKDKEPIHYLINKEQLGEEFVVDPKSWLEKSIQRMFLVIAQENTSSVEIFNVKSYEAMYASHPIYPRDTIVNLSITVADEYMCKQRLLLKDVGFNVNPAAKEDNYQLVDVPNVSKLLRLG